MSRKSNDMSIGEAIKAMMEQYNIKSKYDATKLQDDWPNIVGPMIAKHTVTISARGDVLFVSLDSSALRQELSFSKESFLEKINDALGEKTFNELILK